MTNGVMTENSAAVQRALAVMAERPGLTSEQIAQRIGCSMRYTAKALSFAGRAGVAGCVPLDGQAGRERGWYTAADLPAAREAWKRTAAQRAAKRAALGLKKLAAKRAGGRQEFGVMPVHRQVTAGSKRPLPFIVQAPNSVFALSEAAETT